MHYTSLEKNKNEKFYNLIGNVYQNVNQNKGNLKKYSKQFHSRKTYNSDRNFCHKQTTKMSSQPIASMKASKQNTLPQRKQNIPVEITDFSMFDNSYTFMRKQFNEEMKRVDQEMLKFSKNLSQYFSAEASAIQTGLMSSTPEDMASLWQNLQSSPLVTGEENDKTLKLQFDVSQYDPTEIKVKILNEMLIISANHEAITKDSTVYREYSRQFKLPPGTDPELVASSLSKDGVLTVQVPLTQPKYITAPDAL